MNATQRTILFLIADTGAGHRSAANAISSAINIISQREQEEWRACHNVTPTDCRAGNKAEVGVASAPLTYRIEIVDVFEEYSRFPLREAVKLYGPAIRYNPKLYGQVFHRSNQEATVLSVNSLATPLILNGLLRLFTSVQPDIIVSIHPLLNFVTVRALRELNMNIPFLTVVTDLVSVHFSWFSPGVDSYIVPTEQAKQIYLHRGLDPKRIHMLGMPIDPKFMRPTESKEALQQKFGLQPDIPVVLLVGGGDGAGGLQAAIRAISTAHLPIQLMVVTGRNKRLYAYLQRTRAKLHVPAKILGFVNNMPELMRASDVIVTKAGPGTICEALACNLPVILSGYVPGQEEGNVEYVISNDVGALALDPSTLINELRRLIKPGSPDLRRRLKNAHQISRPAASLDIAQFILETLPPIDQPSIWQSPQSQNRQRRMSGRLQSAIRIRRLHKRLSKPLLKSPVMRRLARFGSRNISSDTTQSLD